MGFMDGDVQCCAALDVEEDACGGGVEVAAPETDAVVEACSWLELTFDFDGDVEVPYSSA